jgi:hypothetical protein
MMTKKVVSVFITFSCAASSAVSRSLSVMVALEVTVEYHPAPLKLAGRDQINMGLNYTATLLGTGVIVMES